MIKRDASLIPTFIPEVLELQVDPSPLVRRTLLEFFDAAMQTAPIVATLTSGMQCIQILLQDPVAATVKRAVISAYPTFRASLALTLVQGSPSSAAIAAGSEDESALKEMWETGLALKESVVSLALEPTSNSSVKLSACKFIEQAAMLLTADIVPAVPALLPAPRAFPSDNTIVSKSDLVRTGEALVGALNILLKAATNTDGQQDIAGPLAITCIRAAMNLVQQRPQFLGRLLPTLLALSKNSSFALQQKEPADGGEEPSAAAAGTPPVPSPAVVSALKAALLAAWNSTHAMAKAWKNKVGDALKALGETLPEPVEEDNRNRASKRPRDTIDSAERPTKQAAVGSSNAADIAAAALAAAPALLQQGGIPSSGPDIAALRQLDSTIRGHIATQNAAGIASTISTLPPLVLADLVALYMPNLPARHLIPPDHVPHMPWLDDLMTQLWPPMPEPQQPPSTLGAPQDPRLAARKEPSAPAAIAPPQDPRLAAAAAAAAAPKLPPMPIPDDIFEPIALTENEKATMRKNAVLRILQTQKTAANEIRIHLVARLAACCPDSDRVTDAVLEYLFEDFHGRGGQDVALAWLYLLFTEVVGMSHSDNEGSGEGGDGDEATNVEENVAIENLNNVPGSRYEDVFLSFLEGLKAKVPPSDRTIVFLLTEAPVLPEPRVQEFLSSLCAAGGEWATLALVAARDVALARPPSRQNAVTVALEASISKDVDVRTMAVRLLANRLYPESSMTALIESFAKEQLGKMEAAKNEEEEEDREGNGNGLTDIKKERDEEMEEKEEEEKNETDAEIGREIQDLEAAAKEEAAKAAAIALVAEQIAKEEETEASRRCALYCALCTKKHSLLRDLFTSFGALKRIHAKAAVLSNAPGLAKTLGPTAPALLTVIQDPPPGSIDLVLVMLGVLTQSGTPPSMLVNACMQLYKSSKDSRVLAPVLPGMDRATVLKLLPSILDLPTETLKQTIARLTTSGGGGGGADGGAATAASTAAKALFSPSEFLAALHTLETGGDASIIRKSMAAIHICISSPELLSAEELARTINQLLTRSQLPPLFMRTVIQSLAAAPRLRSYVVGILGQLAAKQVWNDTTQWQGWVIAAQQTVPESFPTWLQLPSAVLEKALRNAPAEMKANLAAYAKSPQCQVALAGQTKTLLGI